MQGFCLPYGDFRFPFLTTHPFPHPYLCPFPHCCPYICFCKVPQLVVLLEFVVLIYAFLWSLVPVYMYTADSSEDQNPGCFLMAEPKHFPQTILCFFFFLLALYQGLGPQFVALNYHPILKSDGHKVKVQVKLL